MAAAYDAAMGDAAWPALRTGLEAAFARHDIAPSTAADVGCGTGRVLAWLAARVPRVYGVDRSGAMLARAARRLRDGAVSLLQQDFRRLQLPERVDLVTCTFATVNYLTDQRSLAEAFGSFRSSLRSGGWLIFDYIPRSRVGGRASAHHQRVLTDAGPSVWRTFTDPTRGWSETVVEFHRREGPPHRERHVQQHHHPDEMRQILGAAGFMVASHLALGGGGPKPWLQVVARAHEPRRA